MYHVLSSRLYVSPNHPPSAEQKKISPYKFLKDSLDVPELNKVKGSLLAKLESIAAQEGEHFHTFFIINFGSRLLGKS